MKTTITSWSFPQLNLAEVAGLSKVLGLGGVDLGYFYRSSLDRQAMIENPIEYANSLKHLECEFPCLYHLFGDDLVHRNVADLESLDRNVSDFRCAVRFCKEAGIQQIMLLPGMVGPGMTRGQCLENSIQSLRQLVPVARDADLKVGFEPHVHGLIESPAQALDLLGEVPGLGLILDYAHLVCAGYSQESIDVLAPHATHIHLRQAKPGKLQEKLALGTINFNALLGNLKSIGYDAYVAYEYVHQDYMDTLYDDVLTETVLMRDLVNTFLRGQNRE